MDSLTNIFTLVFGINFLVVGLVAFVAGIISLAKKDKSVRKSTSIIYIAAGVAAVYFGIVLWQSSFHME